MPEDVDRVASPPFAGQHDMEDIRRLAELGEDADQDLVGEAVDGRQALIVGNLHVLEVGHAKGRLGIVTPKKEIGLLVVCRSRGASG